MKLPGSSGSSRTPSRVVSQSLHRTVPRAVRRALRRWRRQISHTHLRIVYHPGYDSGFPGMPLDPRRAESILSFLAAEGLVLRRSVERPEPVSLKSLARVHGAAYLDTLHDPATLTSAMGMEINPWQRERLVDLQRLVTGGTLAAVHGARRGGVWANLGGGLHHAHADHGGGFCIFNDVATAIAEERSRGFTGKVLVVDLDMHDGDGTRDLFREDPSVHTYSIHAAHWGETEAVESTSIELGGRVGDARYLETLHSTLPAVYERFDPALVIYLAGSDPAADDALGDWELSPGALLERDSLVLRLTEERLRAPHLAILLAGGYGPHAWRYSARFLGRFEAGRPIEPPSTEEMTLRRHRWLARGFDDLEPDAGGRSKDTADGVDNFGITEEDLWLPGWDPGGETRFLGAFRRHGVELMLERAGILDRLRELGYRHPSVELQLADPAGHTLRVYGDRPQQQVLIEMRLRRDRRLLPGFELLSVEWLLLQNPRGEFSPWRPPLPGQAHPGLGMLAEIVAWWLVLCERLHMDGLTLVPSQFHVAAAGRRHVYFVDPVTQHNFEALLDLFVHVPLAMASRAIAEGRVVRVGEGGTGARETLTWRPEPMVAPVSEALLEWMAEKRDAADALARPRLLLRDVAP